MASRIPFTERKWNLLSILGFGGFTAAVITAHLNPATAYELSIYAATPAAFWLGVGVAFLAAIGLSFVATERIYRGLGIILGGMTSLSIAGLPLLRGYFFHGTADEHAHVGWTKALIEGSILPVDLVYPGIHSVTAFVDGLAGVPIWQSTLFVTLAFVAAYLVFVPLAVRELVDSDRAAAIGAFTGFLLVPTHPIAVGSINAHPSTQAILFAPVVVFLLLRYLRSVRSERRFGVTSVGIALSLATLATVLYHPQQALNVVILLVGISLLQGLGGRIPHIEASDHRRIHAISGVAVVAFLGWTATHGRLVAAIEAALGAVGGALSGTSTDPGSAIASQTGALEAIGVSLPVFYLKMFLVSTIFVVLTGLVVLAAVGDRFGAPVARADMASIARYVGFGLLAMVPVFGVYFVGDVGVYYFREAGFMLMLGSILGAAGLAYWTGQYSPGRLRRVASVALVAGLAIMLVLSVLLVFNSPYIHRANKHVTETKIQGYETAFEQAGDDGWVVGVRQQPQTYYESVVEMANNGRRDGTVNGSQLHDLQQRRLAPYYLVVTQSTVERETVAYEEYRYARADLTAPDRQVGVNRVHSNGGLTLYHVS